MFTDLLFLFSHDSKSAAYSQKVKLLLMEKDGLKSFYYFFDGLMHPWCIHMVEV